MAQADALHPVTAATLDALQQASAALSEDELRLAQPDKWTVAQILEHLEKTYASTAYILGRCAEQGTAKGGRPTPKNRIQAWIVTGVGYFPTGVNAPDVALPTADPAPGVQARVMAALREFDAAASRAEQRLGPRARVANHPVLGPFTVRQWRRFHLFHTRHHMKQIRAVIAGVSSI